MFSIEGGKKERDYEKETEKKSGEIPPKSKHIGRSLTKHTSDAILTKSSHYSPSICSMFLATDFYFFSIICSLILFQNRSLSFGRHYVRCKLHQRNSSIHHYSSYRNLQIRVN